MCSVIAIILDAFLFSSGTEHLPQSDQALISGLPKRPKADAYRDGNDNVGVRDVYSQQQAYTITN